MWKLITLVYLFYLGQSIIGPSYFDDLIKTKEHPFFASKMTLDTTVKNNNLEVYLLTSKSFLTQNSTTPIPNN